MSPERKSLLVRADFVLGKNSPADRLSLRRWRRILTAALPTLLGVGRLCPTAEHVCLHDGETEGHFTAWLRVPIRRRPSRRQVRQIAARLFRRLEHGLRPIHGEVLKIGIRRQVELDSSPAPEFMPLFAEPMQAEPAAPTPPQPLYTHAQPVPAA